MTRLQVTLPPLGDPVDELWEVLLKLGRTRGLPWLLIGGQMMLLTALEHQREPVQVSQDGDAVADVRAEPQALRRLVAFLQREGFELDGMSADGRAHRYVRSNSDPAPKIDVLAPDHVGPRANLTTTPPGRTIEVPGATQALHHRELVEVTLASGSSGTVPRPSLLGAIVIKAAATTITTGDNSRHFNDLALLCSLVADPYQMVDAMDNSERRWLARAGSLSDPTHPAWSLLPADYRTEGREALQILLGTGPPTVRRRSV